MIIELIIALVVGVIVGVVVGVVVGEVVGVVIVGMGVVEVVVEAVAWSAHTFASEVAVACFRYAYISSQIDDLSIFSVRSRTRSFVVKL